MGRIDLKRQHSGTSQKSEMSYTRSHPSYSSQEIKQKLQEIGQLVGRGVLVTKAIRQIGIAESTYYRWRASFHCDKVSDLAESAPSEMARLKILETENNRLRSVLTDLMIERQILKEVVFRKI